MPVTTAIPGIVSVSRTDGVAGSLVSTTMTTPLTPEPLTSEPVAVVLPISRTSLLTAATCQKLELPSGKPVGRIGRVVVDHTVHGGSRRVADVDVEALAELVDDLSRQ